MSAPKITGDQIGALAAAFGASAMCAQQWGWTEEQFIRLATFAWRRERDGFEEAVASMRTDTKTAEKPGGDAPC